MTARKKKPACTHERQTSVWIDVVIRDKPSRALVQECLLCGARTDHHTQQWPVAQS